MPRAENVGELRITKFLVKVVDLETIIGTQLWCKTWLLNSYNHTGVKQNFSGNRKELTKVLGADEETKSHLH